MTSPPSLSPPFSLSPLAVAVAVLVAGCFESRNGEDGPEWGRVDRPGDYDLPVVDGTGIRDPVGTWYHEARMESWALFIQELADSRAPEGVYEAAFASERAMGPTDFVYVSDVLLESTRRGGLAIQLPFGEAMVGKGDSVDHRGPVSAPFNWTASVSEGRIGEVEEDSNHSANRRFVAFFAMSSVPGTLKLGVEFGGQGAAEWRPTFAGRDPPRVASAVVGNGESPVRLSVDGASGGAAILLFQEDSWRSPVWRNVTLGATQPFLITMEGHRDGRSSASPNMMAGVGWLAQPVDRLGAEIEYHGPYDPHQVVLASLGIDFGAKFEAAYGVELRSSFLAAKPYPAPYGWWD